MNDKKTMCDLTVAALQEIKAIDISVINVTKLINITDYMIIATASSSAHLAAIANNVQQTVKKYHRSPISVEGSNNSGWMLVDLGEVVLHIMDRDTREYYQLEKHWSFNDLDLAASNKDKETV